MAHGLYCKYFKDADLTPHGSMAVLHKISETLNMCVQPNEVSELNDNINTIVRAYGGPKSYEKI